MAGSVTQASDPLHRDGRAWDEGTPSSCMAWGRARSDNGVIKIQRAADKAGMDVRSFCDEHYKEFDVCHWRLHIPCSTDRSKTLAQKANVVPDRFIRTTDPDHKAAVEHCWVGRTRARSKMRFS